METLSVPKAIVPVSLIFKLNNDLAGRSFEGVPDDDSWRRPGGTGNPLSWLLGHATISRASLLAKLGHKYEPGLGELFNRGSKFDPAASYTERAAIEAAWKDTRGRMRDAFGTLTDAMLSAAPSGVSFPGVTNNAGLIAFYAFHESYHVGQMGYVRRMLGLGAIAG
jgi:hypothetical protein